MKCNANNAGTYRYFFICSLYPNSTHSSTSILPQPSLRFRESAVMLSGYIRGSADKFFSRFTAKRMLFTRSRPTSKSLPTLAVPLFHTSALVIAPKTKVVSCPTNFFRRARKMRSGNETKTKADRARHSGAKKQKLDEEVESEASQPLATRREQSQEASKMKRQLFSICTAMVVSITIYVMYCQFNSGLMTILT